MSRNAYDGKIAGLYDLEDTLGRGHFAVVKLARHVFTGEKVAVKVIDKTKLDEVSRAHLFQEVRCMKLVQHPNVVRLYEVIDTQTKLYLILELGDGGDMYDYIMKHEGGLDEGSARNYFRQIVHAIGYCHRLHVVHRDLKPENVVFFRKLGMVKLTDFGFSNRFCPGQKLETSCGSLAYSAPEILLGDSYDAPAVDVWSLGVILYMLVCGSAPFQEANDSETLTMIMDCKYSIPPHVSEACTSLIRRMLIRDPERRATLEQITADQWLAAEKDQEQPVEYLPLVSRELVSDEDHAHIIQKMVTGNIATQEDIQDSLDQNVYNHISATYFLLAERKLRSLRQEQAKLQPPTTSSSKSNTHVSDLAALAISPRNPNTPDCPTREDGRPRTVEGLLSPQEKRKALAIPRSLDDLHPCRCLGLSLPSSSGNSSSLRDVTTDLNGDTKPGATLVATDESESLSPKMKNPPPQLSALSRFKSTPNNRRLHSVRSSPQLTLNEIHEEGESEGEAAVRTSPLAMAHPVVAVTTSPTKSSPRAGAAGKYERRRCYAAKARSTASCSSSDATSDEDATDPRHLKRKADKLNKRGGAGGWRGVRRPGADEDDDEAAPGGSHGGTTGGKDGTSTSGGTQERDAPPSPASGGNRPPDSTSSPRQQMDGCDSPAFSSVSSCGAPSLGGGGGGGESSSPPPSPAASPGPSPYHSAATITSLRQSQTLGQLNRFIASSSSSPPPSLLSLEDKENSERRVGRGGALGPRCPGPLLHLLHMRRPSRWRLSSRPASASSSLTSSRLSVVSATAPGAETGQIPSCLLMPSAPGSTYKQGLARLLKHAPALGPVKRWDMNRNGLDVSSRSASQRRGRVGGSLPPSPASSHSKCCSLC